VFLLFDDYIETKIDLFKHLVGLTEFNSPVVKVQVGDDIFDVKALSRIVTNDKRVKYVYGRVATKRLYNTIKTHKEGVIKIWIPFND
jgi:hypothetical protein